MDPWCRSIRGWYLWFPEQNSDSAIGLHHVINSLIWFVFGEFEGATGEIGQFFAGDPSAGYFMAGFFPIMMFGLPAAAIAMIFAAKKKYRKAVAGGMIGIAVTSFLTGITEPIEFSFMFFLDKSVL